MTEVLKALSDPNRRKILRVLGHGEMNVGDIGLNFDFTPPTLSHHLSILKKADLVRVRREGTQLIYSLNTTVMQDVAAAILEIIPQEQVQLKQEPK